jgi:defect-in-organelle-trafficking protein DotC
VTNKTPRLLAFLVSFTLCAFAQAQDAAQVERMMSTVKANPADGEGISVVRESALRESAIVYGAREGLRERSCAIHAEIERQKASLDRRFRFADLTIGRGVLPPVISEARDSVTLESAVMRVASRVYHLDEEARIVDVAPTWRDWLYVGLSSENCAGPVDAPTSAQLKPQTPLEESFYRALLSKAYAMGGQQARDVFAANVARLERSYQGMRRYFDLYARGMVSAPVISSATDLLVRDDPNTLVVGNTVIRITVPVDFVEKTDKWKPLSE